MTTKIAPTLVYAHRPDSPRTLARTPEADRGFKSYRADDAWRELRALRRVFSSAAAHAILTEHAHRNGNQTCGAEPSARLDRPWPQALRRSAR
jgi:hypothetical protein